MNPNTSSSLIHFTDRLEYLKGIIKNGFRFSYCKEEYPKALVNNIKNKGNDRFIPNNFCSNEDVCNSVLIPMVSFCDIPLTRSKIHAQKYGYYGVGIDREFARNIYSQLMPVQYMSSERFQLALNEISIIFTESKNINRQITDSIKLMIGTAKVYSTLRKKKNVLCYEEREWRVIHSDNGMTKWGWGLKDKRTKRAYNDRLHSNSDLAYLSFIVVEDSKGTKIVERYINKLITHIFVKKEDEIPIISEFIMNENNTIFGYALSKECRLLLISKLNSFERLTKDY
ncbi:MAG: hypothetical protein IKY67_11890 [Paludibacteraceae bacterium]|nr:hypothetical protein [Paludibacteraceae bacterium]